MARHAGEKTAARPLAMRGGCDAEADATPRVARAPARNRSNRRVVKNRRRFHSRALHSGGVTRRNPLHPRPPTGVALRARANLQARNPAKTKAALRLQNHPRRPLPRRLTFPQPVSPGLTSGTTTATALWPEIRSGCGLQQLL